MESLVMRRPDLDNLPEQPQLPPGYVLRELRLDELSAMGEVLKAAFEQDNWTIERVRQEFLCDPNVKKTFVIAFGDRLVATATVLLEPEKNPGTGVVHWVAADPEHKGKRLGYAVTLATLHEFAWLGCKDSLLRTDDARLPAIKTYLNLGFIPEYTEKDAPRWEAVRALLAQKS